MFLVYPGLKHRLFPEDSASTKQQLSRELSKGKFFLRSIKICRVLEAVVLFDRQVYKEKTQPGSFTQLLLPKVARIIL